jgi:diaminopropionate ammonia-lyase
VGSLAAAAARHGAAAGIPVVGVEPLDAGCLAASLAAGRPTTIHTPGTIMAGLDCAEVSPAAWPSLLAGIEAVVTVTDDETREAMRELAAEGMAIGESGAAPLAALRAAAELGLDASTRVLLVATEGRTGG